MGEFSFAAAALKTPTRNGYNAQGVNLKSSYLELTHLWHPRPRARPQDAHRLRDPLSISLSLFLSFSLSLALSFFIGLTLTRTLSSGAGHRTRIAYATHPASMEFLCSTPFRRCYRRQPYFRQRRSCASSSECGRRYI